LSILQTVWMELPELRLGQLIENACFGVDPFYIEDEKLETKLMEYLSRIQANRYERKDER